MPKRPELTARPSATSQAGERQFGYLAEDELAGGFPAAMGEEEDAARYTRTLDGAGRGDIEGEQAADERTSLLGGRSSSLGRRSTSKQDNSSNSRLPWYRRPSPWFILAHIALFGVGLSLVTASRLELFTQTVCQQMNADQASLPPEHQVLFASPEQCRHSPGVQKKVAQLNMLLQVIMGILCTLTTPFWGAMADKHGRKFPIAMNVFSFLLGDAVLITVLKNPESIHYLWLLLLAVFEGIFAGMVGGQSIMSAYISDCTEAGSRSGIFSLLSGIVFAGIAVGPALGSFLISLTHDPFAPFWASAAVHVLQFILCAVIMPESLPLDKQKEARRLSHERKRKRKQKLQDDLDDVHSRGAGWPNVVALQLKAIMRPITSIFAPLELLGPRRLEDGTRDWGLPLVALASAIYSMVMAMYSIKMQYAQIKFGWTAVELGNLMSLMGVTRIIALMVIIPLIVKLVRKPHREPVREPVPSPGSSQATIAPGESAFSKAEDEEWDRHKANHRILHDYKFDLILARASILIDTGCYISLALTTTPAHFVISVICQSLGSGANPALSSLGLMFATPEETGQLMAAMSVLCIIASQMVAPILFNGVYSATVSTFPEAFFLLGAAIFLLAFLCLVALRVRRPKWSPSRTEADSNITADHETSDA